jgi:hypothetical protein
MLVEFEPLTASARSLALTKHEKCFYVFFIGTREDCRGRGHASTLIRHHQALATDANLPIWLEATTAKSRNIYLKLGFEVVQEIVLGKGRVGSDKQWVCRCGAWCGDPRVTRGSGKEGRRGGEGRSVVGYAIHVCTDLRVAEFSILFQSGSQGALKGFVQYCVSAPSRLVGASCTRSLV